MSLYEIKGLTFAYPDIISERDDIYLDPCLNDINITIEQGEFVVVAGGSGSGKTTLLRQLKPVLTPRGKREGAITFAGQELSQMDEKMQTQKIGFVMQDVDAQLVTDKVWHELAFGLESLRLPTETIRKRVAEMCSFFGLNSIFHKKVNELSGGQKQLVNLASVLALSPDVVILDEPASQLDPMAARDFFRCLERINKELGITIIITEHRLEELWAMCDRFILLDHGMVLYDGTIQEGVHTLYETEPSIELPAACRIALGLQEKEQVPVTVTDGRNWLVRYDREHEQIDEVTTRAYKGEHKIIEIKDVFFRYDRMACDVLHGLNLSVYEGEILAINGSNGCGKSTLLSLIAGAGIPYRGRIRIGKGKKVGLLPQDPKLLFTASTVRGELGIEKKVYEFGEKIEDSLKERFAAIDATAEYNQLKVIKAMQDNRVSAECFNMSSGYGYNDLGRDTLEKVYASCFKGEDALVRPQITCGTHALALALMSNLRPGDELLSPVGKPYDTLEEVIGIRPSKGSLAEYGVTYSQVDLLPDGSFDYENIKKAINEKTHLVTIQRSKGYQTRPTLSVERIGELISFIKSIKPDVICMVDNCYGEFVEEREPLDVGADMIVGSLIKNPGGGLAPIGGYIVGKKECVENAAYRLTSPGLGKEVGASLNVISSFYQGLFQAPIVTAGALKGAIFAANIYERLGFAVVPNGTESRHDIIQAVTLNSPEGLIAFCKGIQAAAPVDSYVTPEPWAMPGYDSDVIMAAGAFVQGSSIELSADGPLREPYAVYFQGGLTWYHAKLGILMSLQKLYEQKLVNEDMMC